MQSCSILLSVLTLLTSQALAAPKGGGKGGGGGSRGGGGSSSSCTTSSPCSSEMVYLYGYRFATYFSNADLYGQAVLYGIWVIALIACYLRLPKVPGLAIRLAILSFVVCFIFLVTRYALLLADVSVPRGYRHESSIAVLFWRLALPLLFVALIGELDLQKAKAIAATYGVLLYSFVNIAVIVLDFVVSADGVNYFKEEGGWRLSDRDFALTMDSNMIKKLKINAWGGNRGLSPFYIRASFYDIFDTTFKRNRRLLIKVSLIADWLAFAFALFLVGVAAWRLVRRKNTSLRYAPFLLAAAGGLLLTTTFRAIVETHYIMHNWNVVNSLKKWTAWIDTYPETDSVNTIIPAEGFLAGYRVAVVGFPIVQAILEPLGVIIACACTVHVLAKTKKGFTAVQKA